MFHKHILLIYQRLSYYRFLYKLEIPHNSAILSKNIHDVNLKVFVVHKFVIIVFSEYIRVEE